MGQLYPENAGRMEFGSERPLGESESPEWPRVLVVSDTCISTAHGTGYLVLKHFSRFPAEKLANAFHDRAGTPAWPASCQFAAGHTPQKRLGVALALVPRVYNRAVRLLGLGGFSYHRPIFFEPDPGRLAEGAAAPDAVYSVAYGQYGLALTDRVCSELPRTVPLIQYFLDYYPGRGLCRERYVHAVIARADELWVLTEEMAEALRPAALAYGKTPRVQPGFCMDLPATWKQLHREPGAGFRCVITGNFWQGSMVHVVARAWRKARLALPELAPIEWYCHPQSISRLESQVGALPPEIRPVGRFVPEEELTRQLADADLAILPFTSGAEPEDDYARYSLPSRLTELFAAGLPVFCIAGSHTPLSHYLLRHDVGLVCSGEDEELLAQRLIELVGSAGTRQRLGLRARQVAEAQFELAPFQRMLYSKLGARSRSPALDAF